MKLKSFFEGMSPDGCYIVACTPAVEAEGKPLFKWVHEVPPLLAGQEIHDPSEDCYCLPRISLQPDNPNVTGTVWKLRHHQREAA